MEKSTNIKHKIDFLLSNDALSSNQTQKTIKIKKKYDVLSSSHQIQKTFKIKKKCSECNKIRTPSDENNQVCYTCNKAKKRIIPSGNKVIDDFIKYTQTNCAQRIGRMMFVPYEKFKNIKLIGEGGFSKIYKSTWIDSKISEEGILNYYLQNESKTVALKKINNSKNITSKELTELKLFYLYSLNVTKPNIYGFHNYINVYYGITQDPITQDLIFIMPYYNSDLSHYIIKDFFNINWYHKLNRLKEIINSLNEIHEVDIIHRDLHSGNILIDENILTKKNLAKLCDIGISKSATEHDLSNDNEENNIYGIIPYVAPEVLRGKNYIKASDVYSFGMIMWELMVGRKPFWDKNHNTELIIEICDGLRPPIITNAPKGYIDLMKECWLSDPKKRPKTVEVLKKIDEILVNEQENKTEIIESSDIGPVTTNNPDAIYKSRYLSGMIKSASSKRSFKTQSITSKLDQFDPNNKRNFDDNQLSSFDNCMEKVLKRIKLNEDENNDLYVTKRN